MKVTKFKPLDIVESKITGEVHMVDHTEFGITSGIEYIHFVGMKEQFIDYGWADDYRKLSYKDVKINLNTKNN